MLWRGYVAIFSISLILGTAARATEDKAGWEKTAISLETIISFITITEPCDKSDRNGRACIELINSIGSYLKPRQMLLPIGGATDYPGMKFTVVNRFGDFELVKIDQLPEKATDMNEYFRFEKLQVESQRAAAKSSMAKVCLNFIDLIEQLVDQIPEDVPPQLVFGSALNRMAKAIDGHAHLAPFAQEQKEMEHSDTEFGGIGAELAEDKNGALIQGTVEHAPAQTAGLQQGDLIVRIDQTETPGRTIEELVGIIRGPIGSTVDLEVDRAGQKFKVSIIRAKVESKNVTNRIVTDMGPKIQLIRIRQFTDVEVCNKVKSALASMPEDTKGVILDLRGNPGGLLDQAVCIGGLFVGPKPIVALHDVINGETVFKQNTFISKEQQKTRLPMAVLIDSNSASASEIIAGAMQDYKRAWLVGIRTWGKATAQDRGSLPYATDIAYWQTTGRFFQPSGHTNQMVGIQPDFETYAIPNPKPEEKVFPREETEVPEALPAFGVPWKQTRQRKIDQITTTCLTASRAQALFADNGGKPSRINDLQLYTAEEILTCPAAKGQ